MATNAISSHTGMRALKQDLHKHEIGNLYVFHGEEPYLKKHYISEIITALVDDTFREFNLQILDGKNLTPETLMNAVESCPAMADRKVVLVRDLDLYKPPASFREILYALLEDLPDYICLIFDYDTLEFKQDKRLKINSLLNEKACFVDFALLGESELTEWLRRRFRALGRSIDDPVCHYMIFLCGSSMTKLTSEVEKAAAFSTLDYITQYHIDEVCSRTLDAVIFDLTDAIAAQDFTKAIFILRDLISQKNDAVQIFSAVIRHLQRSYASKLLERSRHSDQELMHLMGVRSLYYVKKMKNSVRKVSVEWLRRSIGIAAATDVRLKSSGGDQLNLIELSFLQMATKFGET